MKKFNIMILLNDMNNLNIIITGGAQGIGLCIVKKLAEFGGNISVVDLNEEKMNTLSQFAYEKGLNIDFFKGDVTNENEVSFIFSEVVKKRNRIDVLVNNAGIVKDNLLIKRSGNDLKKFPLNEWSSVIKVNLTAVFLCGREAAYHMIKRGNQGVIINISSISRHGNVGQSNYSASKAGVAALTVVWAKELARYGIRVAGIAPGFIDTGMSAKVPEKILSKIKQQIPMGDLGQPDDISGAVRFIIENNYINGRILEVDGGLRL